MQHITILQQLGEQGVPLFDPTDLSDWTQPGIRIAGTTDATRENVKFC